jgi:hypothetical protein
MRNPVIQKLGTHLIAGLAFLLLSVIYFYPQLQGKEVFRGDTISYLAMSQESREFKKQTGETTLWTNSMFGGMPTYQINSVREGNFMGTGFKITRLFTKHPIGEFFGGMLCFYILMMALGVNPWLGIVASIAFGFATNTLILYEAGHMTKVQVVNSLPLIAAGLVLAFNRKKYIWGGLIFAFGFGLALYSNHIQMTYYFFLTLLFFGFAKLAEHFSKGEWDHFAKATGITVIAILLGIASATSNLWVTYEYGKDTMRGEPILQPEGQPDPNNSSETDGLAWNYAMQWSNGVVDLFASFIPGAAGGSGQELVSKSSPLYKDQNWRRMLQQTDNRAPLYWGKLPFTSGPTYQGAVVLLLFLLGMVLVKGPIKWWLVLGTLLTMLLSMGKNLEGFNRFFFDYAPFFNKFRTPNSVLSITPILMTALGFLAVDQILKGKHTKEEITRAVMIAGGIGGAMSLFFLLLGPSFFDFSSPGDARWESFGLDKLRDARISHMQKDALRTLALIALSAGLIWAYSQKRITQNILIAGIGLLVLFDVWSVGKRYLNQDSFVNKSRIQNQHRPRPVDQQILQDTDPNYRVLDVTVSPFKSASASYFHKNVGGYHPAKLQRIEDIINRHISNNNQKVLDMLNTRYFIVNGNDGEPVAQRNPGALGNAWFVSTIKSAASHNAEINALTDFDPANEAVIHDEFKDYVSGLNPDQSGSITLTDYKPNHLTYQSNSPSEQLAVFSEVWYGPNKGWQAYLDGNPVDHIRANYLLRAMKIPAGEHKIEFVFDPQSYKTGSLMTSIFSALIMLGLLGFGGFTFYQSYKEGEEVVEEAQKAPPVKPTQSKSKKRKPKK